MTNTTVRLEYLPGVPGLEDQGLALQLHLGKLVYRGQAGQEKNQPRLNFFSFISFGEMCNMGDVKIKKISFSPRTSKIISPLIIENINP